MFSEERGKHNAKRMRSISRVQVFVPADHPHTTFPPPRLYHVVAASPPHTSLVSAAAAVFTLSGCEKALEESLG